MSKGGLPASVFWCIRRVLGLERDVILAKDLGNSPPPADPPAGWEFRRLGSPADLAGLSRELLNQLGRHSDREPADMVASGRCLYFFRSGTRPVCQLNISPGPRVAIDAPVALRLEIGDSSAFLGFLYTHPEFRRMGAAAALISMAGADLAARGFARLITHVECSNVASLNTFTGLGWRKCGSLWATTGPRPRLVHGDFGHAGIRELTEPPR